MRIFMMKFSGIWMRLAASECRVMWGDAKLMWSLQ